MDRYNQSVGVSVARQSEMAQATSSKAREGDNFLDQEQDQLQRFTSLLRRVEDLADRVSGPIPECSADTDRKHNQSSGFMGSLIDLHLTRDTIGERIAEAMNRLEQVL